MGDKPDIIVNFEALSYKHEPPSGFVLKPFIRSSKPFMDKYTSYIIGRKPNLPEDYTFEQMADDYASLIRREFKGPVIVMGVSTGGQIAHYLAAGHPDIVRKLVIISAAYRLSENGVEIERNAEKYFRQGKYGKSLAAILDLIWSTRIKRGVAKFFTSLLGKKILGKIEYPNDFLTEIRGDREMNFKDRLKDIKAPTLVLCGELDIGYTAEDVRTTAEGIPNAELILYKGFGHNLVFANGKQIYKDILEFLEKD